MRVAVRVCSQAETEVLIAIVGWFVGGHYIQGKLYSFEVRRAMLHQCVDEGLTHSTATKNWIDDQSGQVAAPELRVELAEAEQAPVFRHCDAGTDPAPVYVFEKCLLPQWIPRIGATPTVNAILVGEPTHEFTGML